MPKQFLALKQGGVLVPATESDRAVMHEMKTGEAYRCEFTAQSSRSVQHHRLFFALLQLTLDYWEPKSSMLTNSEVQALKRFIEWSEKETGEQGAMRSLARVYLKQVDESRKQRLEMPPRSIEALLEWIKREVGHVEYISTPSGLIVNTKSINFNAMKQEQFNDFYKAAFSVCWREVMKAHFEDESELQNIIDQMVGMA